MRSATRSAIDHAGRTPLREYVVVSHRERRITVHQRAAGGAWTERVAIAGGRVEVPSVGAMLVVDEIYRASAIERPRA